MAQALLLPWFPIVLAVGVGGRLLGRSRGFGLGVLCALFWIALVQAGLGLQVWQDTGNVVALIVGSFAIIMMGGWAGGSETTPRPQKAPATDGACVDESAGREAGLAPFGAAIEQFHDWLDNHRDRESPWEEFGEFVRAVLYQCCQATHVKPYKLVPEKQELELLRLADPYRDAERVPARKGVLGHVITTGRSYLAAGKAGPGDLVGTLAQETEFPVPWCFAVSSGNRRLGAVSVGHLNLEPQRHRTCLRLAEQLVAMFWSHLLEVTRSRLAGDDDPTSHLLNREAFFRAAQRTLTDCYTQNEPVAVAIVAVGGCRRLNDCGHWEVADELVREVGSVLRRKVRMDDQIGRFDGSRFVWLLRRVDSELARLIVEQVMARVSERVAQVVDSAAARAVEGASPATIAVCCGLSGAGLSKPDLRTLVARALVQSHRARLERVALATDLDADVQPGSGKKADFCEVCL